MKPSSESHRVDCHNLNDRSGDASGSLAHVDEMPSQGGRRRHLRRDEVGAAAIALAALKIAVRGRSAALAGLELIRIHAEAHGAAGFAPFEA